MSHQETEYFGPDLGDVSLFQLSMPNFHQACLSTTTNNSNSITTLDSTGKRLYAGAHLAIRFLAHYRTLFKDKTVCELGCGIGALGLMLAKMSSVRRLLLTDGNYDTLQITRMNIEHFYKNEWIEYINILKRGNNWNEQESTVTKHVDCCHLYWGNTQDSIDIQKKYNTNQPFDIVIGCELMYYLTDIPALLETVLSLIDRSCGLFFHAHLFRKDGQEQELIDLLESKYQWATFEVPVSKFVDPKELSDHHEWFRMRALISGPKELLHRMYQKSSAYQQEWRVFQHIPPEDSDDQDQQTENSNDIFNRMFKL